MADVETQIPVAEPEEVLATINGAVIDDAQMTSHDGVTLFLDDGRCLVITGEFVMAIMKFGYRQ